MNGLITVVTTPRRPDYYRHTLDELDGRGGAAELGYTRILIVDGSPFGYVGKVPPGWAVLAAHPALQELGTKATLMAIFRFAWHQKVDELLYFEDDVQPCRRAVEAMAWAQVPHGLALLLFCDIRHLAKGHGSFLEQDGRTDEGKLWGCQALKVPRRTLVHVAHQTIPDVPGEKFQHASDVMLGQFVGHYGVWTPSLFDHVGQKSAIYPDQPADGWGRRPLDFPGVDFDAMVPV